MQVMIEQPLIDVQWVTGVRGETSDSVGGECGWLRWGAAAGLAYLCGSNNTSKQCTSSAYSRLVQDTHLEQRPKDTLYCLYNSIEADAALVSGSCQLDSGVPL